MARLLGLVFTLLLCPVMTWAAVDRAPVTTADPVFPDVKALYSTPLEGKVLKQSESNGIVIEEVMFHSEMDGEKRVDIFAYFGYPKGEKSLPAFVWNQAGLGKATTTFVELGARRGYAVLCIDYPLPGYRSTGNYAVKGMTIGDDPRHAPIAHVAIALLKAVSYLESRPEVDTARIGMAGSSWGGFFTTLMVGLDPRLKAGSCFFGTGSLQLGCAWFGGVPTDAVFAEHWATTLDPGWRLATKQTPINWCTGTNDHYFWMPSLMQSYALAGGPKHLALLPNWDHGLNPTLDDEVFGFLDVYLQGKPAFPQVTPVTVRREGERLIADWSFTRPRGRTVASADVMLSYGMPGNWRCRYWETLPAEIHGTTCTVTLPVSDLPYFISGAVVEDNGYRHSTPLRFVEPATFGLAPRAVAAMDCFAEWGGFEHGMPAYLYAYPPIQVSAEARTGAHALVLKSGRNTLPPVRFIAGIPYRLTGYLKAETAVDVTVQLSGQFDLAKRTEERKVTVGTAWTPVTLDFPTDQAMWTEVKLTITVPAGATVLLDDVSLRSRP